MTSKKFCSLMMIMLALVQFYILITTIDSVYCVLAQMSVKY